MGRPLISFADVTVNILAVNATDQTREKEINFPLPQEVKPDDILDSAGLNVEFDGGLGCYVVVDNVTLQPKENKTFKIRLRDLWQFDNTQFGKIKEQVESSYQRVAGTEFEKFAEAKREKILSKLEYIQNEQERVVDNVEKRIDLHRVFAKELESLRNNAVSNTYWRSALVEPPQEKLIHLFIEVENPSKEESRTIKHKQYLPSEVKMEHLVAADGFDVRYDERLRQIFLKKEEELAPAEKKKHEVIIRDAWTIYQQDIENLRERARKAYGLLEKSKYKDTALYLMKNIKRKLEDIELSQAQDKPIQQHISDFKLNKQKFSNAQEDVEALENMLMQLREKLERSRVKNVLQKIKQLKTIRQIAKAIIGAKPSRKNIWRIIIGVVTFVGLLTSIHFIIWGRRSKDVKIDEKE